MNNCLHELFKLHKETVLLDGNGFRVDCILKPTGTSKEIKMEGFSSFIGVSFQESNAGFFGDSFELTINVETLKKYTDLIPTKGWSVSVKFPQMDSTPVNFKVENVAVDRTLGMYLLKCSASTSTLNPKQVQRQISGGM